MATRKATNPEDKQTEVVETISKLYTKSIERLAEAQKKGGVCARALPPPKASMSGATTRPAMHPVTPIFRTSLSLSGRCHRGRHQ